MMTADLRARVAARLGELLARLGELVDADPARELAPVPGDFHGPPDWPITAAPKGWPEGLPWPLSAWQALDAVKAAQLAAASWVESDIRAAVAWLVDPELVDDVLARPDLVDNWRWPWLTAQIKNGPEWCGPSYGWRLALGRLLLSWGADLPPADAGRWPDPGLTHREVAEWARPVLNLRRPAVPYDPRSIGGAPAYGKGLWDGNGELSEEVALAAMGMTADEWRKEYPGKPALGDDLVAEVESWGEIKRELVARRADGLPAEVHRTTLALLCLVERRARESLPGELLAVALAAVRAWASDANLRDAAAEGALEVERGPSDAAELLARELRRECLDLVPRLVGSAKPGELRKVPELGGLMALDAELVAWLAKLDQGEADAVRDLAGKRLQRWHGGELDAAGLFARWLDGRALRLVARVLWRVRVAEQWKRKQTVRPALVRAVTADTLIPAMARRLQYLPGLDDGRILDESGKRVLGRISTVSAEILAETRAGLALLGTVAGHRLVRFIVHAVHDQVEAGDPYALRLELPGGWTTLAEKLRYTSRDFEPLQLLMRAGQHAEWAHPNAVIGGLWTYTYRRGNATAAGRLTITAGEALAPGLAAQLADAGNKSRAARMARRLVPELRAEPPVSAVETRSQGAAWTLHRLALVELVDNAEELSRNGAVTIGPQRWREMANEARLPSETLPRLLGSWTAGDDNTPALLVEPEPGRWTLADAHKAERDFIAESGRRRTLGRENSRKGKAGKGKSGG
jgi:hypothetical protein